MRRVVLPLLLLVLPLVSRAAPDLVIRGGRVIDGTGSPAVAADVAVQGGRIVAVGNCPEAGKVEIDARGLVVAPGFIDVHTHSEDILELPMAENFLRMGVTTIVTGNCGGSKLDVGGFFRALETTPPAVNVASLIGHNTIRFQVMGGSFARPPTAAEVERMQQLVDQGMRDGAVGLSTGLIYLPGSFATTDEIVALAKVAAAHGGIYASHMRYEDVRIREALAEVFRISREAGIPAEVSHIKLSGPSAWGAAPEILTLLDQARAEGLRITQDQYVYTAASTSLGSRIPEWALEGGLGQFTARLADPAAKARIVGEIKASLERRKNRDFSSAVIADFPADTRLNGKTVPEAARIARGSDSLEEQIELILDVQLRGGASAVFHGMNEDDLRVFLAHPLTMIASDAGPRKFGEAVPHPRGYGNNARVLGRYVRELQLLKLEDAVRKMTSLPARTFKLGERGEVRPGFAADLVVFDPATVGDPSTFNDPHHYANGFSAVIVNGVPVIRGGEMTGARPGQPVRRAP